MNHSDKVTIEPSHKTSSNIDDTNGHTTDLNIVFLLGKQIDFLLPHKIFYMAKKINKNYLG